MAGDGLSKICSLTNELLKPFAEIERSLLSKVQEKQILVTITKVSKRIKELKNLGHREDDASSGVLCSFRPCKETFSRENHNCLAEIVQMLTRYLSFSSLYVRHSAENNLVALSEFLIESGSGWEVLLHLLVVELDSELLKISSSLVSPEYLTLTGLFRVLRNMLKYLQQGDWEVEEEYILSFRNSLFNVSWELLHKVFYCRTDGILVDCNQSDSLSVKISFQEAKDVLLGCLLQLFCSLVSDDGMKEITGDSLDAHPIVNKIRQFIPQLCNWSFCSHNKHNSVPISPYFRHKLLVLMIRLNFSSKPQCSTLVLWLQLLKENCQDLLQQSLTQNMEHLDDTLESSPFFASVSHGDQIRNLNSHHLQRQAIFLLFQCSFSLISQGMKAGGGCVCKTGNDLPVKELGTSCTSCYIMGLSELSGWLQRHLPSSIYTGYDVYLMECRKFASYFMHLFMDEDDLLFRMLLQLMSSPLPVRPKKLEEDHLNFDEIKGNGAYLISITFSPIHLFHLLLAELNYDHSVLLDYLISKDMGILCVRYLLRSLRLVCESWDTFLEFSTCGYAQNETSGKKREFCLLHKLGPSGELELSSTSREGMQGTRVATVLTHEAFQNAKQCLLSLKQSVENLHVKNLFPYNPAALLRSFAKFEDLCQNWEKHRQKPDAVP